MTNLINPKPRFGYNPTANTMYDYIDGKDVPIIPSYVASDATWNLVKAKELILAGQPVESARSGPGAAPRTAAPKPAPVAASSSTAFTPIQAAALGISVHELADELTPAQLASIKAKVTPARAIALGLSAAQRSALGIGA